MMKKSTENCGLCVWWQVCGQCSQWVLVLGRKAKFEAGNKLEPCLSVSAFNFRKQMTSPPHPSYLTQDVEKLGEEV